MFMVRCAGCIGGAVEAGLVCRCRGAGSGRARVGRHKIVGQSVLVVAVAAADSLIAFAALATWLGSPYKNISCPSELNKTRSRESGRIRYGESDVLFSACKVVVRNA